MELREIESRPGRASRRYPAHVSTVWLKKFRLHFLTVQPRQALTTFQGRRSSPKEKRSDIARRETDA